MIKNILNIIFTILLLISTIPVSAQKQANWWFFGANAGFTFSTTQDRVDKDGVMVYNLPTGVNGPFNTSEGCFTVSDEKGNLLMSGDGSDIWNKNGVKMAGSGGLGGNGSATQSGIIIPVAGSTTQYYSFSVPQDLVAGGALQYAIVDMSMNGGLGQVISKNKKLLTNPIPDENIAAIKKTDSENFWIINKKQNGGNIVIYVWEATSTGVTYKGNYSFNTLALTNSYSFAGALRFNQDGTRFVFGSYYGYQIVTGLFDPATGIPSSLVKANSAIGLYGFEFSPNSELVYYTYHTNTSLRQVPWASLRAGNRNGEAIILSSVPCTYPQLGPDGRIYGIHTGTKNLIVVDKPDIQGSGCQPHYINNILTNNSLLALPTFSPSFFKGQVKDKSFVCRGNASNYTVEVTLSGISTNDPIRLDWNWGDGSPINQQNITIGQTTYKQPHNYANPGNYTITITPYKSGNVALKAIVLEVDAVDCTMKVNRMIRINTKNEAELSINN